jgi:hypothetical protein
MKKSALLMAMVFFATIAFGPTNIFAAKKDQKPVPAKSVTTTSGPTKKDGTLDMRYKQNKEVAKPAGPTRKDGTPDMRYKANKK